MNLNNSSPSAFRSLAEFIESRGIEGNLRNELETQHSEDSAAIFQLVSAVIPSANTLRALLELAKEIAVRDNLMLHEILCEKSFVEILNDRNLDRKEKQKRLRRFLDEKRFPVLAKIQHNLEKARQNLRREFGIDIELPKDLEGDAIELHFSAKSSAELAQLARTIGALAEHRSTEEIFAILKGDFEL